MAFGSIPSTLIPFNTATLSLRVTFHLALVKACTSINPSGLMDIIVVLVDTEVGVLSICWSHLWLNISFVLLNSETCYSSLPVWYSNVFVWSIEGFLLTLSFMVLIKSNLEVSWNFKSSQSVVSDQSQSLDIIPSFSKGLLISWETWSIPSKSSIVGSVIVLFVDLAFNISGLDWFLDGIFDTWCAAWAPSIVGWIPWESVLALTTVRSVCCNCCKAFTNGWETTNIEEVFAVSLMLDDSWCLDKWGHWNFGNSEQVSSS